MKLLITGAFGNLGRMCVDQALSMSHRVVALDLDRPDNRKAAASYAGRAEVILGDLRDESVRLRAVAEVDAILHNASLLPPTTEEAPELAYDVNVIACNRLIEVAEKSSRKPVFVFPSSVTVFGLARPGEAPKRVDDSIEASDNYTHHKIAIEDSLRSASIPWVVLRVGVSVDGRTLSTDRETFRRLLSVRPDNPLEYVHPKDVALAMCRAAVTTEARNRVLLIGGGESCRVTQREFLESAFHSLGLPLPLTIHGTAPYYTHWMDTTESQALLRYQRHSFADYRTEMAARLRRLRTFLLPVRGLARLALPRILKRL
jgi:nucleoside-diphosphate-sugar epimerase